MNAKLHVLFICGWYPSRVLPYNGDFIQRHAEAVSLKHNISVIHIITDPNLKQRLESKTSIDNGIHTYITYVKKTPNPFLKLFYFFLAFFRTYKQIENVDIVHLNEVYPFGVFALFLKKIKNISYIISEHWTMYYPPNNKEISFFQKKISKVITENAKYICPVTKDLGKQMRDLGLNGNYKNIPNVVDTNLFKKKQSKTKTFKLLHISSMKDYHKNISGILSVLKKLQEKIPEIEITFIGGEANSYTEQAINKRLNLSKINFINQVPQSELPKYFLDADLFILFSNIENLPCVILESFATGTPVISTNVGGIAEYFPNNFGSLIKSKNEDELLSEILKFYKNELQVASIETMNSYVIDNFSNESICAEFTKLYLS